MGHSAVRLKRPRKGRFSQLSRPPDFYPATRCFARVCNRFSGTDVYAVCKHTHHGGSIPSSATVAAPTTAATTILARLGFVHGQGPAFMFRFIQAIDRRLCFRFARHFDKAKALATPSVAI
jgi:hypothetical protein